MPAVPPAPVVAELFVSVVDAVATPPVPPIVVLELLVPVLPLLVAADVDVAVVTPLEAALDVVDPTMPSDEVVPATVPAAPPAPTVVCPVGDWSDPHPTSAIKARLIGDQVESSNMLAVHTSIQAARLP